MKKSNLISFIKNEILSELSTSNENTQQDIEDTKELTKAIADLAKTKKEAGLTEEVRIDREVAERIEGFLNIPMKAKFLNAFEDLLYDLLDDEPFYVKDVVAHLSNEMHKRAIADLAKTKKETGLTEENIGLADIEEMGYEAGESAFEEIKSKFKNKPDHQAYRKGFFQGYTDSAGSYGLSENINEEEESEPTKSDLKKSKGLAKAKEELAQLTKQMKSLARDYKTAEGTEKEKIVGDLKKKTKLKKELESIIFK